MTFRPFSKFNSLLAATMLTSAVDTVEAATISESDFGTGFNFSFGTDVGFLDIGINSISGTISPFDAVQNFTDFVDGVVFSLANSLQVTSVSISKQGSPGTEFYSATGSFGNLFGALNTSSTLLSSSDAPVASQGQSFSLRTNFAVDPPLDATFDYTWTIGVEEVPNSVASVPLPAGLPLMLGGFAALALINRRLRRQV